METTLKDLLNEFDRELPKPIGKYDLMKKGFSEQLINNAINTGIFDYDLNTRSILTLSSQGMTLLMQIRTKEQISALKSAIKDFETTNKNATEDLKKAIQLFDKASQKSAYIMVWLTIGIAFLTSVMSILAGITLYKIINS